MAASSSTNTLPGQVNKIKKSNLKLVKGRPLGEGGFGTVYHMSYYKGFWQGSVDVAAKKVLRRDVGLHELEILSQLDHPNIVKLIGVVDEDIEFMLILEFCEGGSLRSYLDKGRRLTLKQFYAWLMQTALPLEFLKQKNITHKDVKSPNYLITADNSLKLCDFGLAKNIERTASFPWMAPEILKDGKLSPKYDIFALGVVIWELWTGKYPHKGLEWQVITMMVCDRDERLPIPEDCPGPIKKLIEWCWKTDWKDRPTIEEVISEIKYQYLSLHQQQEALKPLVDDTVLGSMQDNMAKHQITQEHMYEMNAVPKGTCLIINNMDFADAKLVCDRDQAIVDSENLRSMFTKLGFSVTYMTNLSSNQMIECFRKHGQEDHNSANVFVCFIFNHVMYSKLAGCDGKYLTMQSILDNFSEKQCPSLAGKPKIFFIQDHAVDVDIPVERLSSDKGTLFYRPIQIEPDLVISLATMLDKSHHNPTLGSWFINSLVDRLQEAHAKEDLISILIGIRNDTSMKRLGERSFFRSTLQQKRVFLDAATEAGSYPRTQESQDIKESSRGTKLEYTTEAGTSSQQEEVMRAVALRLAEMGESMEKFRQEQEMRTILKQHLQSQGLLTYEYVMTWIEALKEKPKSWYHMFMEALQDQQWDLFKRVKKAIEVQMAETQEDLDIKDSSTDTKQDFVDAGLASPLDEFEDSERSKKTCTPADYLDQISKSVGPDGDTLELPDGIAKLEIPPRALDKTERVTLSIMSPETDHPPLDSKFIIGPIVNLEPCGLKFSNSKRMKLSLKHAGLDLALCDLEVWTKSTKEVNAEWQQLSNSEDTHSTKYAVKEDVVKIRSMHFCIWCLLGKCHLRLKIVPFIHADLQSSKTIALTVYALKSFEKQSGVEDKKKVRLCHGTGEPEPVYSVHHRHEGMEIDFKGDIKDKDGKTVVWTVEETSKKEISTKNINRGSGNACFDLTSGNENVNSIRAILDIKHKPDDSDHIEIRIEHDSITQHATGGAVGGVGSAGASSQSNLEEGRVGSGDSSSADAPTGAKNKKKSIFGNNKPKVVSIAEWKLDKAKITTVDVGASERIENTSTNLDLTTEFGMLSATERRDSCTFKFGGTVGVNANVTIKTKIPVLVEGGATMGGEISCSLGRATDITKVSRVEVSSRTQVTAKPGAKGTVKRDSQMRTLLVPIKAKLDNGEEVEGEFEGVYYTGKTSATD